MSTQTYIQAHVYTPTQIQWSVPVWCEVFEIDSGEVIGVDLVLGGAGQNACFSGKTKTDEWKGWQMGKCGAEQ